MPGDVPLDQSAGPLTESHPGYWAIHFVRWELIVVAGWGIGLTLAWLSHGETGTPGRIAVTGLIAAMAGWWILFGRRVAIAVADDWRGLVYVIGLVALFVPIAALIPVCSWMLFGLCPQPFMVRAHGQAMLWVTVLNIAPPAVALYRDGFGESFEVQVVSAAGIVVFAHFIGTAIERVVRESQERGELIA